MQVAASNETSLALCEDGGVLAKAHYNSLHVNLLHAPISRFLFGVVPPVVS